MKKFLVKISVVVFASVLSVSYFMNPENMYAKTFNKRKSTVLTSQPTTLNVSFDLTYDDTGENRWIPGTLAYSVKSGTYPTTHYVFKNKLKPTRSGNLYHQPYSFNGQVMISSMTFYTDTKTITWTFNDSTKVLS